MAASSYGDSYNPDPPKRKIRPGRSQQQKVNARTTPSSKARQRAKNHGDTPARPKPKPVDPLAQRADALTALRYGAAEQSLVARGQAIPSWFDKYKADRAAQNQQYVQQSAPVVAQAQAQQQAAGQVAPGIDPNTPAGSDAQLAAQGRSALQGLGVTTLQSIINANQGYNTGREAVASTAEVGEQGQLARDRTQLAKDKGQFRISTYGDLQDKEHTKALEDAAYGLDVQQEQNKVADAAAGRRAANNEINQYGYSKKAWAALSPDERRRIMAAVKAEGRPPKAGTGGDKFTPVQRQKTQADVRRGINLLRTKLSGKTTAPAAFWEQAYAALVNEGGPGLKPMDPLLARAVIQIARQGKAGPKIAQRILRDYGLKKLPKGKPLAVPDPYVLPTNGAPTESGQYPH